MMKIPAAQTNGKYIGLVVDEFYLPLLLARFPLLIAVCWCQTNCHCLLLLMKAAESAKDDSMADTSNDTTTTEQAPATDSPKESSPTPPITSSILSSLDRQHIHQLLHPPPSASCTQDELLQLLNEALATQQLTPQQFWEKALPHLPWNTLQGDDYAALRLRKVQLVQATSSRSNPKKSHFTLPPPNHPPHYTKIEVAQLLMRYKPASTVMDRILSTNYVPTNITKKGLYSIQKLYKEGGDLSTPWEKNKKQPDKKDVPIQKLELPPPADNRQYTEDEIADLSTALPPPPNPPYYTKSQTVHLLLQCGIHEKLVMKSLVHQKLVPVGSQSLMNLMKSIRNDASSVNLEKDWNTKSEDKDAKKKKKRLRAVGGGEGDDGPKKKQKMDVAKGTKVEASKPTSFVESFMEQAKLLKDAEFVRHVSLEFERRGYVCGLRLAAKKDVAEKPKKKKKNEEILVETDIRKDGVGEEDGATTEAEIRDEETDTTSNNVQDDGKKQTASSTASSKSEKEPNAASLPRSLPLDIMFYPSPNQTQLSSAKRWDEMYSQLKAFHDEHGHFELTDPVLSKWTSRQKRQWAEMQKEGGNHHLTMDRVEKLNALGFGQICDSLNLDDGGVTEGELKRAAKKDKLWNDRLNELKEFKETHGT
jgi:hypothetical protein